MLGVFTALIYVVVAFCLALLLTVSSVVETEAWWEVSGPLVISFFVYVAVMVTVLEVVRSSFKAVFVCFVQVNVLSSSNHACLHSVRVELNAHPQSVFYSR